MIYYVSTRTLRALRQGKSTIFSQKIRFFGGPYRLIQILMSCRPSILRQAYIDFHSCFVSGKPSMATINSSPEGLYRNSYNLTWSIKSSSPLKKVRILFRKMVRQCPTRWLKSGKISVSDYWCLGLRIIFHESTASEVFKTSSEKISVSAHECPEPMI